MTFAEELKSFKQTHRYSELVIGGIKTSYLLCGNSESEKTLVYLVGGTGFSAAWFKHIQLMEHEYRILTLEYPVGIEQMEKLASTVLFVVPIVTHHIICGLVEWFYIKLGRTEEARELVLDFQKKTIVTMIIGYLGELLFLISFLVMIVSKQTSLPQWACIVNTLPIMLLILPTKIPAKGNVAGAIMFLGLTILL